MTLNVEAECHNQVYCVEYHYAECRYAECQYSECHGAEKITPYLLISVYGHKA
jgi:hypothetical protein